MAKRTGYANCLVSDFCTLVVIARRPPPEFTPSHTTLAPHDALPICELLSAYLAQHTPRNMRGFARRATQNMFYKDVLRRGYNPYAEFDGDPFARFSQDDGIQQRLHTPIATAAP